MATFNDHREIFIAVAVVALLVAIIGASFLINRPAQAQAGEVVTQPANSVGDNAFSPSVANPEATPSTAPSPPANQPNLTSVNGAVPGLYGGTKNNASCDRQKMIDFLKANPDKAAAWAYAEGIAVADIPDYIKSLTPVLLRYDTRVTNHGYQNGVATPYQAVLQAGTAVLVDRFGVPRARCYCGNPLLSPVPQSTPHYTGDRWPSFQPGTIIVVVPPGTPVTIFTLGDPNGKAIGQAVGSDTPNVNPPPAGPVPSPAASPGAPKDPLSGTYKLQAAGKGSNIGEWQGYISAEDCSLHGPYLPFTRFEVVVVPGKISINFLNANGSGPVAGDGSFSLPLTYTPPIENQDITIKGKVTLTGIDGSFDELGNTNDPALTTQRRYGCTYPFTGTKVS